MLLQDLLSSQSSSKPHVSPHIWLPISPGYRITNKSTNETIEDLDEGEMVISLNGSTYEVAIDIVRTNGESFMGKYTGPIVCEDASEYGY